MVAGGSSGRGARFGRHTAFLLLVSPARPSGGAVGSLQTRDISLWSLHRLCPGYITITGQFSSKATLSWATLPSPVPHSQHRAARHRCASALPMRPAVLQVPPPPQIPVVEVHYGLQRVPPAGRNVPFKPRQQRDHHVHSETLVFPEMTVWGNISPANVTASYRVSPLGFTFPVLTDLVSIQGYYRNFKGAKREAYFHFQVFMTRHQYFSECSDLQREKELFTLTDNKSS